MNPTTKARSAAPKAPEISTEELALQVSELQRQVLALGTALAERAKGHRFNGDDSAFLIWTLGFTAGAHMGRNGEVGEVIFSRCRDLYMKAFPGAGPIAPSEVNPS